MKVKVRSDQILEALARRHRSSADYFLTEVKTGSTHHHDEVIRIDALGIARSWKNPMFSGYEVKVDRSDFLRDEKWRGYLPYCHRFSFVCPMGMIELKELPEEVGLIWYNPETKYLTTKRKSIIRDIKINADMLYYIILSRLDEDRHPFFTDRRDQAEAYIANTVEAKELGRTFGTKLVRENRQLREDIEKMDRELKRLKDRMTDGNMVKEIIRTHGGINTSNYNWEQELIKRFESTVPPDLLRALEMISVSSTNLLAKLKVDSKSVAP